MNPSIEKIRHFLQFIALQFIKNPNEAELRMAELPGGTIRFRLILEKTDVARIIGKNGMTASAIRALAKAAAEKMGLKIVVHMVSHDEVALEAENAQDN